MFLAEPKYQSIKENREGGVGEKPYLTTKREKEENIALSRREKLYLVSILHVFLSEPSL